jgi:hypothetical protein
MRGIMAELKELPQGYKSVLLHELPKEQQRAYLDQVYGLLKENYGSYAESEDMDKWEKEIYSADNPNPTNRIISMVLGPDGKVAAASAAELYKAEEAVLISYTIGKPGSQGDLYVPLLAATKGKVIDAVEALQADKVPINIVAQEHKAQKAGHALKIEAGMEAGQVPLELFEEFAKDTQRSRYTIPVYKADVKDGMSYEAIVKEASQAHLFLADIKPSNPDKSLTEILSNFMDGYTRTNSYFAGDKTKDPGYQSVQAFTQWLNEKHPGLTYAQAVQMGASAKDDPASEFQKVYSKTREAMKKPGEANPGATRTALFNGQADNGIQTRAEEALAKINPAALPGRLKEFHNYATQSGDLVAKKIGQMELSDYLLNKQGRTAEEVAAGFALQQAAADDSNAPGVFGNLLARRQMAEDLMLGNNGVTKDKFRALEILENTIAEAELGQKFNSYAQSDRIMETIVEKRNELKSDPDLKGFAADIQQTAQAHAVSMGAGG